ncbi:MAG: bifunctional 2-C-methyl-D-erythritol 4-phosphate cytidylyltransferase/2-C-methyl-D-erythritol 2,4-cyclodiphosphate synthase [Azospirillaceae bacterium]
MPDCVALIVAAGRGVRFGGDVPKQYRDLAGVPILRRTVTAFLDHPAVDGVRVVIDPADRAFYDAAVAGLAGLMPPVAGGADRQDSVRLGLESLGGDPPATVLIQDAARPLVDAGTIAAVRAALDAGPGAIAAVPVSDTLKRGDDDGRITSTIDRTALWRAQTPQGFRFAEILAAHRAAAGAALTDDAAVAERAGLAVALVPSREENLKVTTEADLARASALLAAAPTAPGPAPPAPEFRTGNGFDVHRFAPGDDVTLCGIRIPHDRTLAGHSDADVGLHALTDALLGTIAAGDIGDHFPPSDPRWRGADSATFLVHAADLVARAGGRVVHVDVTLMAERPKIGPHRDAMMARVAGLLGLAEGRVSVKATTTERLGFVGRREGIAASATATIAIAP